MNSKRKGNAFEVEMAFRLRDVFPNCRTSRFMGRLWLDSLKVDLTDTDPYYFQCKATENTPAYHKILEEMPQSGHTNVILHKRNNKGVVAVMRFDDFLKLIKK
ncbi:MAG: hypothetical protein WAW07_09675 [Bacteroidales bacterium]